METPADTAFTVFIARCEASMRLAPDLWLANQADQLDAVRRKQQIKAAAADMVARDRIRKAS
jgi:hypothetical protein